MTDHPSHDITDPTGRHRARAAARQRALVALAAAHPDEFWALLAAEHATAGLPPPGPPRRPSQRRSPRRSPSGPASSR